MTPLVIALFAPASAADLLVPDDYTTVQDAVDAASNGDHIIVTSSQDGAVVVDGVDVTIRGIGMNDVVLTAGSDPVLEVIGDADVTFRALTMDGEGSRRVLRLAGSGTQVDLVGVKVSNGSQNDDGGAIRNVDSSLDIFDSILCDNETTGGGKNGGAIYLESNASLMATRTVFVNNQTQEEQGGAVYNDVGSATFSYTTLMNNRADKGSALLTKDTTISVSDSIVADNEDDKNANSQALRGEGGGSGITGGGNLYSNNIGGDIDGGYLPGDAPGTPDLVNAAASCATSDMADFTSTTGGNSDTNDAGAAGADSDGDGYGDRIDCAPSDNTIHPGATEVVGDLVDQNCDGLELCFVDADDDGFPITDTRYASTIDCSGDGVSLAGPLDCDDSNPSVGEADIEIVGDGLDQDCDGGDLCYVDEDNDGYRLSSTVASTDLDCTDPGEALPSDPTGDCDDTDDTVYPTATESIADGADQDCDGADLCYVDGDNDGFGSSATTIGNGDLDCNDTSETDNDQDCNDADGTSYPGADDVAGDAVDQDCNGQLMCWSDGDGDGVAGMDNEGEAPALDCDVTGLAFTVDATDCDDNNAARFPGNTEEPVSGVDEDCDGEELCYLDGDGDGDGTDAGTLVGSTDRSCTTGGVSTNTLDCDDGNDQINLAATEGFHDGVDQNCDTLELCPQDVDGDDYGSATQQVLSGANDLTCQGSGVADNLDDCNDGNANIYPGATELPGDATDQDCDGLEECYVDDDGDTYGTDVIITSSALECDAAGVADRSGDCRDTGVDPETFYPGAPEVPSDGLDQNCDGYDLELCFEDLDDDGYGTPTLVEDPTGTCLGTGFSLLNTDCDDGSSDVNPGIAPEDDDCDGIDNDCSEVGGPCEGDDDWDGDGVCASVRNTVTDLDSEYDLFIDDCLFDSDGDGWGDGEELRDPFDLDPASDDSDGDGVTDDIEWPRVSGPSDPKPDLDSDGLPNVVDPDDDGDGYDSVLEGDLSVDSDGDNIPDREDVDDDEDSVLSIDEFDGDSDLDGTHDRLDTDDDGDTWSTYDENVNIGSGYLSIDSDGDGRLDRIEGTWLGTVPVVGTQVDCTQVAAAADPNHVTIDGPEAWRKDFDGDSFHDLVDDDDDGDGKLTVLEGEDDIDGDGCPNSLDVDSDGDGKLDVDEGLFTDTDVDSIPDIFDADDSDGGLVDSDGDGVLTIDETLAKNGTRSLDPDTSCSESYRQYTDPYAKAAAILAACDPEGTDDPAIVTSKGDLAIDGLELGGTSGYDPVDRDGDGIEDWRDTDDDNDTVPTWLEVGFGCDPGLEPAIVALTVQGQTEAYLQCLDPKGVVAPTFQRIALSGPPGVDEVAYVDTDGDGLLDFQDDDDDGDGVSTADEVSAYGLGHDRDGDDIPDHLDTWDEDGPTGDADADGIPRDVEEALGLDPWSDDTDGDGVRDDEELGDDWENPRDTDGDGTWDVLDPDDDDDGVDTADESRGDTDGDGLPDYLDPDSDDDGVADGDEFGLDDDCDGDPDHVDPVLDPALCDQPAFDPGYYERQGCTCTTSSSSWLSGWLLVGMGWLVRRR